jgi:maltose/maltodextrin transport system permease protein
LAYGAMERAGADAVSGAGARRLGPGRLAWFAAVALATLAMFYAAFALYVAGQPLLGFLIAIIGGALGVTFSAERFYNARFILPGIAAVLVFVAFPVIYTVQLGFTNFSSFNLLTRERATEVLLATRTIDPATERPFSLVKDGAGYRVYLPSETGGLITPPLALDGAAVSTNAEVAAEAPGETLAMRDTIKLRTGLATVEVTLPDGTLLKNSGLRSFASMEPEYILQPDGSLKHGVTGDVLTPDDDKGFFVNTAGETVPPGWRVNVGFDNFVRVFTQPGISQPMVGIFMWTMVFATLSTVLVFAVGLALAIVLQWPHLRGKAVYRVLLILPYAVPSFISILVFRGLFNQNFGEINLILGALFGIAPEWTTDPMLARAMIIIVNVWLGYPYMMLLGMGFLQGIPADNKKAAALEGASAWQQFSRITLPQILPPFLPMLIATFAYNFNNIVLVLLLTRGGPDIPGTLIPAGSTDILGSFTFRMAFSDSAQQFGLAGAITFLIFTVVAALAYANFVAMRRAAERLGPAR